MSATPRHTDHFLGKLVLLVLTLSACTPKAAHRLSVVETPDADDSEDVTAPASKVDARIVDVAPMPDLVPPRQDMAMAAPDAGGSASLDTAPPIDASGPPDAAVDASSPVDLAPPIDLAPPVDAALLTLSKLVVKDPANASKWALKQNLRAGDLVYSDRTYTFVAPTAGIVGQAWIMPANGSKTFTGDPLFTFDINMPATVMLGLDTRVPTPSWMVGWTATTEQFTYVDSSAATITHKMMSKSFPAGTVSLGPNICPTSSCNLYVVVVAP